MLDTLYGMVGVPLIGALLLIVVALAWYLLGNRAGLVAFALGASLLISRLLQENAVLQDRASDNEEDRDAISSANRARIESRRNNSAGGLRDDDGFKRK